MDESESQPFLLEVEASVLRARSDLRLGVFTAEGENPVRILASPDALRLLDLDARCSGVRAGLLERARFEEIARLHRAANRGAHAQAFSGTLRVLLRDGGERRLLARAVPDPESSERRSLGILLDITARPDPEDDLATLERALDALDALDEAQDQG